METRRLGSTDLHLTTLGIGTWAIGGDGWRFGWGNQDEGDSVRAIVHGVELGINWIDTAAVYGNGRAEEMVGQALRPIPASRRPIVATKCGRIIQPDGGVSGRLTRESVTAECEASLRRLGVETIDLYQIHWPDPDAQIEEAWRTLEDLRRAGKIRYAGVSNHSVAQMDRLHGSHPIASLQPPYSLFAREVEAEVLPYCGRHQIGVVAYSPMAKGLLTGTFTRERAAALPENDHRSRDPKFLPPQLEINLQFVESLRPLADRQGRSVGELAIAWVLRRPEVTSAIVGARRPEQLDGVVGAAGWNWDAADFAFIDERLQARDAALRAAIA